jgi:hypothetical protein
MNLTSAEFAVGDGHPGVQAIHSQSQLPNVRPVPREARECPLSTMLVRSHAVPAPFGHQHSGRTPVNPLAAHSVPGANDVTRPHPARMYDYYLGGKDNWQADREAADKILAIAPEVRAIARANRHFLRRAVTYLAKEKGVTQFLDIGTGIPTSPNVHQTAAASAPGTRVVYADNDPVIHAHANALLTGTGTTKIILADLRDPDVILAGAREFLDFTQPVALLLVAILHFIPDAEDPAGLVAAYRDALAPGSYLALSHGTSDFHTADVTGTATAAYDRATAPLVLRPRPAIEALLAGFNHCE